MKIETLLKTNSLRVIFQVILSSIIYITLTFTIVLTFFLLYGSGARASEISELWYVESLINYIPILGISFYWMYQIIKNYKKQASEKFKLNLLVLIILLLMFFMKEKIMELFFL